MHTGSITWVPEIKLHTKCGIIVKDFPFDTQCCEISFYSWAHSVRQMSIKQFENKNVTNITHLSANTEWTIFDTCASNNTIQTSVELDWSVVTYSIRFKRNSLYHVFTLIMPSLILSLLSVFLFLMPPESGKYFIIF